jgi:hypothetical protein
MPNNPQPQPAPKPGTTWTPTFSNTPRVARPGQFSMTEAERAQHEANQRERGKA